MKAHRYLYYPVQAGLAAQSSALLETEGWYIFSAAAYLLPSTDGQLVLMTLLGCRIDFEAKQTHMEKLMFAEAERLRNSRIITPG